MKMTRRTFFPSVLALALAAVVLAEKPAAVGTFKGVTGLQLYSLRDSFKIKGIAPTLDKVKAWGITEIEIAGVQGLQPEAFRKELDSRGMKAISGHWPFERLEKEPAACVAEAKAMGCSYVACAWVPHGSAEFTEADARKAITVFNKAGEVAVAAGLKFAYHAHGYEFQPHGDGTLFDLMAKEMKAGVADFEMDVFWIVHPGQDPVKLLQKYPGRFTLMHLKDLKKGARTGILTGHAPNEESVALGTGQVNWAAVLKAAEVSGVKHYFIEDEAPTVEDQVPVTLGFLKGLTW
jgi:sugar phosphate isomerase/epimerase